MHRPAQEGVLLQHLVTATPLHPIPTPSPLAHLAPNLPRACATDRVRARVRRTVDLAYVLKEYGINFRFCTKMIGVEQTYKNEAFYQKTFDADSKRVSTLFEEAPLHDIAIERRSFSSREIQALMRPHDLLVMALVDRRYLYRAPTSRLSGFLESAMAHCFGSSYVGHYVLVTGYDEARRGYHIKDPAKDIDSMFVTCEDFDAARRSHGTDEDLILIPWEQEKVGLGAQQTQSSSGARPRLGVFSVVPPAA